MSLYIKMLNNLEKNRDILSVLKNASPKLRKAILQNADDKLVCILVEIIVNFLQGNVPTSSQQKSKLKKYKNQFRILSKRCVHGKHINKKKARKVLVQSGGALPFLIPLLLPLIAKAALGGAVAAGAGAITKKIIG